MNIRLVSDLHLEFYSERIMDSEMVEHLLPSMNSDADNTLVLAGDMCTLKKKITFQLFLDIVCKRFKNVIYVYGNHEYYKMNYPTVRDANHFEEYDNFIVLNDEVFENEDYVFIGSTLWADCENNNPLSMFNVKNGMNDFRLIRTGPQHTPWQRKFSELDMIAAHQRHKEYIIEKLTQYNDKQVIVITHHAPSFQSVSEEFKSSNMNGGYASELSNIILDYEPLLWVHGHMHRSSDYFIGKTRVVCNPRGYPSKLDDKDYKFHGCENPNYNSKLILTV